MNIAASVRWVALSQSVKVLTQLVSVAVLARLLPPTAYGTLAMALAAINFANLFRDFGLQTALIRHPQVSEEMKDTIHQACLLLGSVLAVLLVIGAIPIARVFDQPQLTAIICLLAVVFPISSLSLVHQAMLERSGQFRILARIEVISGVTGLITAILLAILGAGIWALVGQMLWTTVLTTLQLRLNSQWQPSRRFSLEQFRKVWGIGADLSIFRLVTYFENNADSIIIGRILGPGALGIYSMSLKVVMFPLQNIAAVLSRALLPAMSHHQGHPEALGRLYLRSLVAIIMITAPMTAGLFMLREPFIALVFGPKWKEMADILQWLALVGFIQSITTATPVVFIALGQSRLMLWLGIFGAVLYVSSFVIGVQWGIAGVAFCYFLANLINLWPCLIFSMRAVKIPMRLLLNEIAPVLVGTIFLTLVLWQCEPHITGQWSPAIEFAVLVILGSAAYACGFLLMRPDLSALRALVRVSQP